MGELKKLSLISETKREAREIEKELEANPELDNIVVTEDMDAALFARIKALEENRESYDTDGEDEPPKKTIPYRRKKRRRYLIVGLAAVLVFGMGTGGSPL